MTTIDDLEDAQQDLESLLTDVLYSVLGEEAYPSLDALPAGPVATSWLAAHDELEDTFLGIEVRVGAVLARLLASRMMAAGDPSPDDLIDTVGELGNIIGGNVKTLLFHTARLSLPVAELAATPDDRPGASVCVRASVFGQVAELQLIPDAPVDGLYWPPSVVVDEAVESET